MVTVRSIALSLAAAGTLVAVATPAAAYPRHGWGGGRYYGHHHRGSGTAGALIGGLLIGGTIAAVASAADDVDSRRAPEPVYDTPPPRAAYSAARSGQGAAVDLCSEAAESDSAPEAQVTTISRVERTSGGWSVEGVVDTGRTRMDGYRQIDSFRCAVDGGEVVDLRFGSGEVAYR